MMSTSDTMAVTLRESRLILERLVQAAGAPPGLLPSARDCALFSAALLDHGYDGIAAQVDAFRASGPQPVALREGPDGIEIDGAGQHAWYVAACVLDLAIDGFRRQGNGRVRVTNVGNIDELALVAGLAEQHGLAATATREGAAMRVVVSARPAAAPTCLDRIRREGIVVRKTVWWKLYAGALEALAPDSFESRRHAGTVRIEADGRLVGRADEDETDLSMLTADVARVAPATSAGGR